MDGNVLIDQIFNYGFPAIIAMFIFFAYRDQTATIVEALKNNTEAMIDLKSSVCMTDSALEDHDDRTRTAIDCIQQSAMTINRIDVRTLRIEELVKRQDLTGIRNES